MEIICGNRRHFVTTSRDRMSYQLQPEDQAAIEELAKKTNSDTEQVERVYEQTLDQLSAGARIRDFLTVLTIKNVRDKLRHNRKL